MFECLFNGNRVQSLYKFTYFLHTMQNAKSVNTKHRAEVHVSFRCNGCSQFPFIFNIHTCNILPFLNIQIEAVKKKMFSIIHN